MLSDMLMEVRGTRPERSANSCSRIEEEQPSGACSNTTRVAANERDPINHLPPRRPRPLPLPLAFPPPLPPELCLCDAGGGTW